MKCYKCNFENSAYAKRCKKCSANITTLNTPLSAIKKSFLLFLLSVPFFLLINLSSYSAPLLPIAVLMIGIPFLFYSFQYYRMKSYGSFVPLEISQFYIFVYYFSVSMLFIQNTRLSLTVVVLSYIIVHLLAYFLFISTISRHREWIVAYGIFVKLPKVDRDKKLKSVYSKSTFIAVIAMLTKIAKYENAVSVKEAEFIRNSINNFTALAKKEGLDEKDSQKLRKELVDTYKNVKDNDRTIESYANYFVKYSYLQRVNILQELVLLAKVEQLSEAKKELLYSVGEIFRFESDKINRYIGSDEAVIIFQNELKNSYSILGCEENETQVIIKKRYRDLVKQYHPDMIYSQSLDETSQLLAKEKIQKLNEAYELIKNKRGW